MDEHVSTMMALALCLGRMAGLCFAVDRLSKQMFRFAGEAKGPRPAARVPPTRLSAQSTHGGAQP